MSLRLNIHRCTNLRSVQKFVSQDPYVTAHIEPPNKPELANPTKHRTKAITFGGTDPTWHSHNKLHLTPTVPNSTCVIQVWDKELLNKDRLICSTRLSLAPYEEDGEEELALILPLEYEGQSAGDIHLTLTYEPVEGVEHLPAAPVSRRLALMRTWRQFALNHWRPLLFALSSSAVIVYVLSRLLLMLLYYSSLILILSILLPLCVLIFAPATLGWAATYGLSFVVHAYPIVFGAIHIVPWVRFGERKLWLRVCVDDFSVGPPPNLGYTNPVFVGATHVQTIVAVTFDDIWNAVQLVRRPVPLSKVPDFELLLLFDVEVLEVVGFNIDMEVARGRLNINEMTRCFAVGDVAAKLGLLQVPRERVELDPRWPNSLQIQAVRARKLLAMDSNGLSDPYAVISLRGHKFRTKTIFETLNPMWNSDVYQIAITDPSAVLHVEVFDRDGLQSDYIGQWIITIKHLICDPKHCEYSSMEIDREGWVDLWAVLADKNWKNRGKCGEVNLRLRWSPDAKVVVPPPKAQKAIDQITENANETKLRLGDMDDLIVTLNHVPILFNFHLVIVRGAKVSIKDLFKHKTAVKRAMNAGGDSNSKKARPRKDSKTSVRDVSFDATAAMPRAGSSNDGTSLSRPKVLGHYGSSEVTPEDGEQVSDSDSDDDDSEDAWSEVKKRPFVIMPTIQWKTQFAPRHGDPGITVYKVMDRFFRGLVPKLAAHSKLNMILMRQSTSGLFAMLGDDAVRLLMGGHFSISSAARSVATQANFIRHKTLPLFSSSLNSAPLDGGILSLPSPPKPMRILTANDDDFLAETAQDIVGTLDACWSGQVPPGAGFRWFGQRRTAWKPWVFTIKGASVYCKRDKVLAKDRVIGMELVTSVELADGEITLRLGTSCLHLRANRHPDGPVIEDWARAFERVRRALLDKSVEQEQQQKTERAESKTSDSKTSLVSLTTT